MLGVLKRNENRYSIRRDLVSLLLKLLFISSIFLFVSLNNTNLGIVRSPTNPSSYEETVVIFWDQGVVLNTSYCFNKGKISFSFLVAVESNSSVLFSLIHATEYCCAFSWTPTLEETFVLEPGELFFNTHTFSTSDRSFASSIWYYCTVPTTDSNATITFTTTVLDIGHSLPSIGFALTFLTSIIVAAVYKYSQKKNHLKNK